MPRPSLVRLCVILAVAGGPCIPLQVVAAQSTAARRPIDDCSDVRIESVVVTATGHRSAALDTAAARVMFWFRPAQSGDWQSADVPITVGHSLGVEVGTPSGAASMAFRTSARDAVAAAAHERAFAAFAPESAVTTVELVVHFGLSIDARSSSVTRRRVCIASAMPDNPRPVFPSELLPELRSTQTMMSAMRAKTYSRGTVRAVFVVDSLGIVDPSTFHVLEASDPGFEREVRRALSMMRYFPASIDGRPAAQAVEQEFTFERR